ncbi:hypothetical protein OF83DRAFT_1296081 [Amylostereum chailletii]|nr:hypothetical protein OF83DRAFT_1296081 [Amylostereum chailletii]
MTSPFRKDSAARYMQRGAPRLSMNGDRVKGGEMEVEGEEEGEGSGSRLRETWLILPGDHLGDRVGDLRGEGGMGKGAIRVNETVGFGRVESGRGLCVTSEDTRVECTGACARRPMRQGDGLWGKDKGGRVRVKGPSGNRRVRGGTSTQPSLIKLPVSRDQRSPLASEICAERRSRGELDAPGVQRVER